jgi:hypothetical protein
MRGFGADMAANAHAAASVGNRDEIPSKASAAILSQTVRALGGSARRSAQGEHGRDYEATAPRGSETEKLQVGIHPWFAPVDCARHKFNRRDTPLASVAPARGATQKRSRLQPDAQDCRLAVGLNT